jgi:alkanesulfonate monooxygenase SsuD/methylene tetrahydromethanopterin reductase-like flavin-dependent oxidoreductase (luciferase family)
VKIGVQLPEVERRVPWSEMVAIARTAEAVGLDSIWLGDHLLYDLPGGEQRGPWECWTALAALASVTERVALGPLVASTGFHEPAMLAKKAATVDAISEGRLILGLGAGWNEREYRAFGFPYDRRVSRFEEAFTIVRSLLAGEAVSFHGEFHHVEDCLLDPAPRPGGPPILLGSIAPRMGSIALPHVAAWNVWFTEFGNSSEGFAAVKTTMDAACTAAGRGPDDVAATAAVYVQAPGGLGRVMGDSAVDTVDPLTGESGHVAERLAEFAAAGATHLQIVLDPITVESVEWFGDVAAQTREQVRSSRP